MKRKLFIVFLLLIILSASIFFLPSIVRGITQTRYLRVDTQAVNGLTGYILGTSDTGSVGYDEWSTGLAYTVDYGIRVWVRSSSGSMAELTSGAPIDVGSRSSDGQGEQSTTWSCPQTSLNATDSLVITDYLLYSSSWHAGSNFTTEQLGALAINSSTWTVYLYTVRSTSGSDYYEINWGKPDVAESYFSNFVLTPQPSPVYTLPSPSYNTTMATNSIFVSEAYVYCNDNQANGWSNPTYAYDNNTSTAATRSTSGYPLNSPYLVLNLSTTVLGSKIAYYVQGIGHSLHMAIDIANQTGSWTNVFDAVESDNAWENATFTQTQYTAMRFHFNNAAYSSTWYIYEAKAVNDSHYVYYYQSNSQLSCQWTDTAGNILLSAILECNNSGSYVNSTLGLSGTSAWANFTLIVNNTVGVTVSYKWFCEDIFGNWNSSMPFHAFVTTSSSNPPSVGQFSAPSTVYAYQQFNVSTVLVEGSSNLSNCTLTFNVSSISLTWTASGNSTSKSDPDNYCNLVSSYTQTVNSTALNVTWTVQFYWNASEVSYGMNATAFDQSSVSATATWGSSFTFVSDLVIASGPTVNVTRTNPSSTVKFQGQLYYRGTSTSPYSSTGVTVYSALNSSIVGTNSSIASNGQFQVTTTSEASIGTYTYQIYSVTLGGTSTTNQTVSFIVETVTIAFNGPFRINVGNNCSALTVSGRYTTDNSPYDGTITLNDTLFLHITVGRRDFKVASISGGSYSITTLANNPTTYCIWEELGVTITPNATNPSAGQYVSFNVAVTYLSDGSTVSSFTVNILRDSAHYSSSSAFTDHSDSQITHFYTTENITDATYDITAFASNSPTIAWGNLFVEVDQINAGILNLNVGSSSLSLYHCRWSSNHTSCVDGSIYVNGTAFTINSTGWASVSFNFATVGLRLLNLTGASVEGTSLFGQVPANPRIIWNQALIVSGGISASYMHVGDLALVYYTIDYEYDFSPITDGTVLLNSTAMIYNSVLNRWEQNVTSAASGACLYLVSSISGNLYGITTINNVGGDLNCTFYANINMRTVDVNGDPLSNAIVYMDNGTLPTIPGGLPPGTGIAIIGGSSWLTQTVSLSGWANWTGITASTVQVYVVWLGVTVNSTWTLGVTADANVNVDCFAFPFAYNSALYHVASNASISSAVYSNYALAIAFSSSGASYVLVSDSPRPTYLLNVTYDLALDYTTYLHVGISGDSIVIGYPNWADMYVKKTDHAITSLSVEQETLSMIFAGNASEMGEVDVYCGSRGDPPTTGGFTTQSYLNDACIGLYVFNGSQHTVFLEWQASGPGPIGGIQNPSYPSLYVSIAFSFPDVVQPGQKVQGVLNVSWTGFATINLNTLATESPFNNWILEATGLPLVFNFNETLGQAFAQAPVWVTVPANATQGTYTVSCVTSFTASAGTFQSFRNLLTFTVEQQSSTSVPAMLIYLFLASVIAVTIGEALFASKTRKPPM